MEYGSVRKKNLSAARIKLERAIAQATCIVQKGDMSALGKMEYFKSRLYQLQREESSGKQIRSRAYAIHPGNILKH